MLNERRVKAVIHLYENEEWSAIDLADLFGVAPETISHIINGHTWKQVTHGRRISRYGRDTEFRCAVIEARLEQGIRNYSEIAKELGISRQAVSQLVRTKGLGKVAA